jgi:hypothetical protein
VEDTKNVKIDVPGAIGTKQSTLNEFVKRKPRRVAGDDDDDDDDDDDTNNYD